MPCVFRTMKHMPHPTVHDVISESLIVHPLVAAVGRSSLHKLMFYGSAFYSSTVILEQ